MPTRYPIQGFGLVCNRLRPQVQFFSFVHKARKWQRQFRQRWLEWSEPHEWHRNQDGNIGREEVAARAVDIRESFI
jgi:hypothetical protein